MPGSKRPVPLLLTAVVGILLSLASAFLIRRQQLHFLRREIEAGAENRFAAIQREVAADLFMLTSVSHLLNAPQSMTLSRFAQVSRAVQGDDASHVISWLPRVDHSGRAALEHSLLALGGTRSFLTEVDPASGAIIPAPERAHYYPVLYSIPETVGRNAVGFNAESRPETRAAMRQAIASRAPASTGPLRYVDDKWSRVAVYSPVWWDGGTAGGPDGFLAVGLRTDRMVERALAYLQPVGIQVSVWDETEPHDPKLLYRHASRLTGVEMQPSGKALSRTLRFANRDWKITCEPVLPLPSLWAPALSGLAGLCITGLLILYLRHQLNRTEVIEAQVRQRTEELQREIAERRRTEAQLAVARDQALEASRLKSEFLANVSHELRTPLNGVVGTTEILLASRVDAAQREWLGIIRESANSLLHLISDVLDSSRMEAGSLRLEIAEFSPEIVVESALDIVADRAQQKGLDLAGWIDAPAGTQVRGDAQRVRQVLLNLISNAVKFTSEGSVTVRAWPHPDDASLWHFEVSDTGIGIAPEDQQLLFRRFVQIDGTSTRQFGGTGLGLAISHQLVQLMNGQTGVRSAPGAGSTFWFDIPLRPAASALASPAPLPQHLRVAVEAGPATRAAIESWLGPDRVLPPGPPSSPDAVLIAPRTSSLWATWTGPRICLRQLADAAADAGWEGPALNCPVHRSKLLEALNRLAATRGPETHPKPESPPRQGRILLVEDNPVNQKVAVWMLSRLGYETASASDGIEALEAIRSSRFEAVLMDCQMPKMDGFEATRAIRELPGRAAITPVIALTANAMQGDREQCLAAGMDDYIAKPLDIQTLASTLDRWISNGVRRSGGAGPASL